MTFAKIFSLVLLVPFSSYALEQEVLITTDFIIKAGASQIRTFDIHQPEHLDQLVMVGFNPTKVLSVECSLQLFDSSNKVVGSYNCGERQNYLLKTSLPVTSKLRAQIEVTNSNFTASTSSFSVINRFKFISLSN